MKGGGRRARGARGAGCCAVLVAAVLEVAVLSGAAGATTQSFTGAVSSSGTSFRTHAVSVPAAAVITATLDWDVATANLNLGLRDPSGAWVKWAASPTVKPEVIVHSASATGTWTLGVSAKSGAATYTLTVEQAAAGDGATVGDLVWRDVDGDGVQDGGETGLAGASVRLYPASSSAPAIASTVTGSAGSFSFTGVPPGSYRLEYGYPPGYFLGPAGAGGDSGLDSDASQSSGRSPPFDLVAGQTDLTRDAAAVPTGSTVFLGSLDAAGIKWRTHAVTVSGPATLRAALDWDESASANLDLFLQDPTGKWVLNDQSPSTRPVVLSYGATQAGTWTLGVKAVSGTARYALDVLVDAGQQPPGPPTYSRTIGGSGRTDIYPSGLDVDGTGKVYVADTGNDRVAAYAADGSRLWVSGSRGRALGQFAEPRDVAVLQNRVYVADTGNNRVQVLDAATGAVITAWSTFYTSIMGISAGVDASGQPIILATEGKNVLSKVRVHGLDGAVRRVIGTGFGTGDGQLNEPRDAATDAAGAIYVADFRNHRLAHFSATGAWLGAIGSLGQGPGQFNAPYGIDLDDAGFLYVADSNNDRIQKLTATGGFVTSWGTKGSAPGEFTSLRRAVAGPGASPLVYGADLWGYKIRVFTHAGAVQVEIGGAAPPAGGFNKPTGVAASTTSVFVADTTNQRIQRFAPSGAFELLWGTRGFGEDPGFNWPRDVAISADSDSVWVADTKNNRLIQYSFSGVPSGQKMGSLGSNPGEFHWPHAVAAHGTDLIVADTWNHRVQRVRPPNTVVWSVTGFNYPKDVTVAGDTVYVADTLNDRVAVLAAADGQLVGTMGTGSLHRPEGIAVDPGGDVWVGDTAWNRVVELSASGAFVQKLGGPGSGHGQLLAPTKLEIQENGAALELYVTDTGNDRVEVFRIG